MKFRKWQHGQDRTTGAFIQINPHSGYIRGIFLSAATDQETRVIMGALARISRPRCWRWIRRLLKLK